MKRSLTDIDARPFMDVPNAAATDRPKPLRAFSPATARRSSMYFEPAPATAGTSLCRNRISPPWTACCLGSIAADIQVARNVYLFSSPADYQYEEEIKPHLHLLLKYRNFNLILSNSTLVRGHGEVAAYNTPMLFGIVNALGRGATPRFTFDPPQPEPASQATRHLQRLRARKAIAAQLRGRGSPRPDQAYRARAGVGLRLRRSRSTDTHAGAQARRRRVSLPGGEPP